MREAQTAPVGIPVLQDGEDVKHSDLLALLPVQWTEFPVTGDALMRIAIREQLPAPSIVLIRRPDLPLTPAAEFFCDVMRRYVPAEPRRRS